MAEKAVKAEIAETGALPVPLHIRNAPTRLMKQMGYSKGYLYPHNYPGGWVAQEYLPEKIRKSLLLSDPRTGGSNGRSGEEWPRLGKEEKGDEVLAGC